MNEQFYDNFTFTGPCGHTIKVEDAQEQPHDCAPFLPPPLKGSDMPLFAGSAGELVRHDITPQVFFARMADRLNEARAEAVAEALAAAADRIAGQSMVGAGSQDEAARFGFERGIGVAVNILRTTRGSDD